MNRQDLNRPCVIEISRARLFGLHSPKNISTVKQHFFVFQVRLLGLHKIAHTATKRNKN